MTPEHINYLVKKAKAGDRQSFSDLVLKFHPRLEKAISHYIFNPQDVHDVAQDTWVKIYKHLDSFHGKSSFYTWLYRIAINTAKNQQHSSKRAPIILEADDLRQSIDSPELQVACLELQKRLDSIIAHMPSDLRRTWWLRDLRGLSYLEISKKMKCPIGTVRSRIFRARSYLSNHLV